jgi:hypothetical protein
MRAPKPGIRESLSESTALLPLGHPDSAGTQRRALGLRAWLITAFLFMVPLVTYWPATFHDYGLRDDYSNLREAHEEPAVVLKFCASTARPIYGLLLQATYGQTRSVQNLQWMRLLASLLLGAISLVMFRGMRSLGWSFHGSLCFAVLLALVPSAQVIAGWAIGWPYAATALLAIAGFFTAEGALAGSDPAPGRAAPARAALGRGVGQWSLVFGLMVVSALIYQSSALLYVVPLAAALIANRERSLPQTLRWLGSHLGVVLGSLGIAYCIMSALYAAGVFVKSGRVAFEHHWGEKLVWFLTEALPNGLSLFVLNDDNHRDRGWYLACAGLAGLILVAGLVVEWRRHGRARGIAWAVGLFGLPVFALGISLVAAERYATYRTILAMTAVLLCFLVASLSALTRHWSVAGKRLLATVAFTIACITAQHHAYALIAVPQGNEWQLILQGARHVRIDGPTRQRVFAIASSPADVSTATIYHDEFGSLSSNSEWVPKEMFKRAMHDLHPEVVNLDSRYEFAGGYKLPPGEHYDVIIDLHDLRRFYVNY